MATSKLAGVIETKGGVIPSSQMPNINFNQNQITMESGIVYKLPDWEVLKNKTNSFWFIYKLLLECNMGYYIHTLEDINKHTIIRTKC